MKNRYEIRGDVTSIFIDYKGEVLECLIDTNDLKKVNSIEGTWGVDKHHTGKFYVRGPYKGKKVLLHRFLLKPREGLVVDHINLNPLDNRRSNTRVITNAENKQNLSGARSDSTSGVRGVRYRSDCNSWVANIKLNGVTKYLGSFADKQEAEKAVKEARRKYMPYSQEALTTPG